MTKAELLFLEKVFAKEIQGSFLQSKSKMALRLESDGYLQKVQKKFGGHLGDVVCEGYVLTFLGNITYCTSDLCKEIEDA
jgi:hypothetical protein